MQSMFLKYAILVKNKKRIFCFGLFFPGLTVPIIFPHRICIDYKFTGFVMIHEILQSQKSIIPTFFIKNSIRGLQL